MRKVNIRQFRNNIKAELNNLPLTITKLGEPIAEVVKPTKIELCEHGSIYINGVANCKARCRQK